jgi:uncharacterized membrane protein YhhN
MKLTILHKTILAYSGLLSIHSVGLLADMPLAASLTKPLLVPCLIVFVGLGGRAIRRDGLMIAALSFSWLGDMLLMLPGEGYFMGGLAAFFSAHVFYIWIFSRGATFDPLRILPFLTYVALLLAGPLNGKLPESLQIPVYSYVAVITTMGCFASLRNTQRPGYELVLVGSILFILSDSFLALNKFSSPLPLAGFWVMLTYGLAQYFIVKGYLAGNNCTC